MAEGVRRIATDATPSIIGSVDWEQGTYLRVPAVETMAAVMEDDVKLAGIADKELMGIASGSLAGFPARPNAVLFIGVDNTNAM